MPARKLTILLCILIATFMVGLGLGSYTLSPTVVAKTLLGHGNAQQELLLFGIRMPRLLVVALGGVGLALSGAILQALSRNALADPGLLGLTSGAGLAVMLQLHFTQQGISQPEMSRPLAASVGAFGAALLVYALAFHRQRLDPDRLLLCGIAVNAGLAAAMLLISMRLDRRLYDAAVIWTSGSASGRGWGDVAMILPWLCLLVLVLLSQTRTLDALELDDETATSIGVPVEMRRILLLTTAVGLAGTAMAAVGGVGFIGLLGPHIARRLVGPRHMLLLPASALSGATLMIIADTIARTALAPVDLPVGVVVALLGAPYFLYLMTAATKR